MHTRSHPSSKPVPPHQPLPAARVRSAASADFPALLALAHPRTGAAANADSLLPQAESPVFEAGIETLLADTAGEPQGYLQLRWGGTPPSREWMRESVELARQYVSTHQRGTGLAARLLDAALRHAAARGMAGMWLKVRKDAPQAIRFYQKCGFRIVGTGADAHASWVMHRRIERAYGGGMRA